MIGLVTCKQVVRNGLAVAAVCAVLGASATVASASTWEKGDVFAGFVDVTYDVYSNSGAFKENVSTGVSGGFATGCAFDVNENFYATTFNAGKIAVLDGDHPHGVLQTITSTAGAPESVVFAQNGDFYVGTVLGTNDVERYNAAGVFQQAYDVQVGPNGSDWIDLAKDQKTLFYTSEGPTVFRYDVDADAQLSDFASGIGNPRAFALRLLPPGDGSGGLLVAAEQDIKRLNGSGNIVDTYDQPGEDFWFALNLDPNGTSFWSAGLESGNLYRFNIATGAVEVGPISTGDRVGGLCVKGELTAGGPGDGGPPATGTCANPTIERGGRGNIITGTDGPDVIKAGGGGDSVRALGGDDVVCAGKGGDSVFGGAGDDKLLGQDGPDSMHGGEGDDRVKGDGGPDELGGDEDDDTLLGGRSTDQLRGGSGEDVCDGGAGKLDSAIQCESVSGVP